MTNGDYPTEPVDCPRCDGDGEVCEADIFMGDGYRSCTYCMGRGEVEVCANCLDDLDGCTVCNPPASVVAKPTTTARAVSRDVP